jgi:tRNA-splicing ligase RtcB
VKTIMTERIPIFVWGDAVDEGTLAQARNLANLPFAFHHVALMPDAHVGYGMPIGGVLAARGRVIPHAVGLDIGCGVRAWNTHIPEHELAPKLEEILHDIQRSVPQGFHWHDRSQADRTAIFDEVPDVPALHAEIDKAAKQIGSLGGGNHFLELQADPNGIVWAMIHSGSRNVGKQMGEHYDRLAKDANRASRDDVPLEWGLAHVGLDEPLGREYLDVMTWCLGFARENRRLMAESIAGVIARRFPDAEPGDATDIHHNYAAVEEHFGEQVVVHRKGAVRAVGTVLVPGSMGTASYIGRGLSNPDAFESCSHGAGRAMGRKQAERSLPAEQVLAGLEQAGVKVVAGRRRELVQEAPAAYKDIEDVMRWQADLVEPTLRLTPVGVVKG